jgi:2-polyprenyl-6-methoxyphenol hydroxylase-like FAD-dependent oxidoreductase
MVVQYRAVDNEVLVVGGGIAGVALARALHQRGIPYLVRDRLAGPADKRRLAGPAQVPAHDERRLAGPAPVPAHEKPLPAGPAQVPAHDAGLGLNLPGNAVRAVAALGLGDGLSRIGTPTRRREYRTARGRLMFAVDEDAFWGKEFRPRCVRRADLLALLRTGLPDGTVRWNSPVTAAELADPPGFVVGADGVHSVVRQAMLGEDGLRSSVLSTASWRFTAPNPGVDCWCVWSGPGAAILLIPVDDNEVYGYASATRGGPVAGDPAWLRATFAGYAAPVPDVVTAVLDRPGSLYHSPVEEVRIGRWSRNRAVLVGDAAHATAPVWAQGAALAVEDALVLAELLATQENWAHVGTEYERRRRSRVAHVQAATDRFSRAAGLPTWLRDTVLPLIGPRVYRAAYGPLRT